MAVNAAGNVRAPTATKAVMQAGSVLGSAPARAADQWDDTKRPPRGPKRTTAAARAGGVLERRSGARKQRSGTHPDAHGRVVAEQPRLPPLRVQVRMPSQERIEHRSLVPPLHELWLRVPKEAADVGAGIRQASDVEGEQHRHRNPAWTVTP